MCSINALEVTKIFPATFVINVLPLYVQLRTLFVLNVLFLFVLFVTKNKTTKTWKLKVCTKKWSGKIAWKGVTIALSCQLIPYQEFKQTYDLFNKFKNKNQDFARQENSSPTDANSSFVLDRVQNNDEKIKLYFKKFWSLKKLIVLKNVKLTEKLWSPDAFKLKYSKEKINLEETSNPEEFFPSTLEYFFKGFEDPNNRPKGILKLRDFPKYDDFKTIIGEHFDDLFKNLPFTRLTRRDGALNLASYVPDTQQKDQYRHEIHKQNEYVVNITLEMLEQLKKEGIFAKAIVQFVNDAIFIPSGAPRQVRNINSCIKVVL